MIRRPPRSTLFPYTTLFRSRDGHHQPRAELRLGNLLVDLGRQLVELGDTDHPLAARLAHRHVHLQQSVEAARLDRKSTRLNSSHSQISYAVFCLKKKKKKQH